MSKHVLFAATFVLALGASGAYVAHAQPANPQNITGTTTVHVTPVTSQGELAAQLEKMGYTDIKLTPVRPTDVDPRPDITDCTRQGSPVNSPVVPCHSGWNGTAMHNGKLVNIVVDDKGQVLEK